jgi:hypothetical protein
MPGRSPIADTFLGAMDTIQNAISFLFNLADTTLDFIHDIQIKNGLKPTNLKDKNQRQLVAEEFFFIPTMALL